MPTLEGTGIDHHELVNFPVNDLRNPFAYGEALAASTVSGSCALLEIVQLSVAVLAVLGERLSGFKFPDTRENTGKFCNSSRGGGKTARFPDYKSAGYTQIPYAPEQRIFWSQQGIVSRIAVNNSANSMRMVSVHTGLVG